MGFSDFILAIFILTAAFCGLWIFDINPITNKIQIYNQQCTKMILDNTYCKGQWLDQPTITFTVDKIGNTIKKNSQNLSEPIIYNNCSVIDRKNWSCMATETNEEIFLKDGKLNYGSSVHKDTRQISRLKWVQNRLLKSIASRE